MDPHVETFSLPANSISDPTQPLPLPLVTIDNNTNYNPELFHSNIGIMQANIRSESNKVVASNVTSTHIVLSMVELQQKQGMSAKHVRATFASGEAVAEMYGDAGYFQVTGS